MLATQSIPIAAVSQLPMLSASEMKRQGWRGVLANVRREGHLVITNHNVPEAVILPPEQYDRLVSAATKAGVAAETKLQALCLRFRQRMQALQAEEAEQPLSTLMSRPMTLGGSVLAGDSY